MENTITCRGCYKEKQVTCKPSYSEWARSDALGIYTGVYCDECYDDPDKYPYRRDDYTETALANGEVIDE